MPELPDWDSMKPVNSNNGGSLPDWDSMKPVTPGRTKPQMMRSHDEFVEPTPQGPTQEEINLVPGLSAATGIQQRPLDVPIDAPMAPAGSVAYGLQNVIEGAGGGRYAKMSAAQDYLSAIEDQSVQRQREYEEDIRAGERANSESRLAISKSLFGPVMGTLSQGAIDGVIVPGAKSIIDTITGLPNLEKASRSMFVKKVAKSIFGEDSDLYKQATLRADERLSSVSESVKQSEEMKRNLDKLSSLPGRMNLYGDDKNSYTMRFLTALPEGVGSTIPFMAMSAGTGALVGRALMKSGASEISALTNGMIVSTLLESGTEAGNAFTEAVSELQTMGYSRDEAMQRAAVAGYKTFAGNLALLGVSEIAGTTKDLMRRTIVDSASKLAKKEAAKGWAKIAGKTLLQTAKSGFVEGLIQEQGQAAISGAAKKQAAGEGATILSEYVSPEAQTEGAVGFVIGALAGGAEAIASNQKSATARAEQKVMEATPGFKENLDAMLVQPKPEEQPVANTPTPQPTARPIEQIRAEMQPVIDEIAKLEKQIKPTKAGSNRNLELNAQLQLRKSQLEELSAEADLINREMIPRLGATGELNLSPEDMALLQQQFPQQVDPRLAAIEQQGEADRQVAQWMEAQNALQIGSSETLGEFHGGQEGVGGQEGGRVQQGVQGEGLASQGKAAQEERLRKLDTLKMVLASPEIHGVNVSADVSSRIIGAIDSIKNSVASGQASEASVKETLRDALVLAKKSDPRSAAIFDVINSGAQPSAATGTRTWSDVTERLQFISDTLDRIPDATGISKIGVSSQLDMAEKVIAERNRQIKRIADKILSGTVSAKEAEILTARSESIRRNASMDLEAIANRASRILDKIVSKNIAKVQEAIQIKLGNQTHTVTDPADIQEIQSTRDTVAAEIEAIKNQPMTSAERAAAIKEVGAKVEQIKQDVVNFPNTRKAIRKHAKGGYATAGGFLEVGAAIVQDLMAMGADSFQKFVQTVRAKVDARSVYRILQQYGGMMGFYNASRQYLAQNPIQTQTITGDANGDRRVRPNDNRGTGRDGSVDEAARNLGPSAVDARTLGPSTPEVFRREAEAGGVTGVQEPHFHYRRVQEVIDSASDPNAAVLQSVTAGGRLNTIVAYPTESGAIWVDGLISNGEGKSPNFYRLSIRKNGDAYIEWNTTGPDSKGFVPGQSRDMARTIADTARQFGATTLKGMFVDGRAAALYMVYDDARIDGVGREHVLGSVPVQSVIDDMRSDSGIQRLMADAIQQSMDESDANDKATDDLIAKMDELRGKSNITYLQAGLNPLAAIDAVLNQIGRETLGKKLGIDWNTATAKDYLDAIVKLIGGIEKTVNQTAVKIAEALRSVGVTTLSAIRIAEAIHAGTKQGKKTEDDAVTDLARANEQGAVAEAPIRAKLNVDTRGELSKKFLTMAHPYQIDLRNKNYRAVHDAILDYVHLKIQMLTKARDAGNALAGVETTEMRKRVSEAMSWMAINEQGLSDAALEKVGLTKNAIKAVHALRELSDFYAKQYVIERTGEYNRGRKIKMDRLSRLEAELQDPMTKDRTKKKEQRNNLSEEIDQDDKSFMQEAQVYGWSPVVDKYGYFHMNPIRGKNQEGEDVTLEPSFNQKFYFPLMRNGDHVLTVKDDEGKVVGRTFIFGTSDDAIYNGFALIAEQGGAKVKEIMGRKDFTDKTGTNAAKNWDIKKLDEIERKAGLVFDASYADLLARNAKFGKKENGDPLSREESDRKRSELSESLRIALANLQGRSSIEAHRRHRTGLPGYSNDIGFILDAYSRMMANRIALVRHGDDIADAMDTVETDTDNTNVRDAARSLKDSVMNPGQMSDFAQAMANLDFNMFLGLALVTPMINRTQPWVTGFPALSTFYGEGPTASALTKMNGVADAIAAKGAFSKHALNGLDEMTESEMKDLFSSVINATPEWVLSKDEKTAVLNTLLWAAKSGDLQARPDDSLGALDRGSTVEELLSKSDVTDKAGKVMQKTAEGLGKVAKVSGIGMTWSEIANRIQVMGAVAILTEQLGTVEVDQDGKPTLKPLGSGEQKSRDRLRNAERMNGAINFTGGPGNAAKWKQNKHYIAQALGRFKSVIVYNATMLHAAAMAERAKGKSGIKPYVQHHMIVSAIAGQGASMVGYPLALAFRMLLKGMDKEKEWDKWWREAAEKAPAYLKQLGFSDAVANGATKKVEELWKGGLVNALTGWDMTASFAPNIILKGENIPEAIGFLLAGPAAASVITAVDKAWKNRKVPKVAAVEVGKAVTPRGIKGLMDAYSGKAEVGGADYELTAGERTARAGSIQLSRITERREALGKIIEDAKDEKQFKDTLAAGLRNESLTRSEVNKLIADWNNEHRGDRKMMVTPQDRAKIMSTIKLQRGSKREIEKRLAK